jgi:hypothetical protein
MPATRTPPRPHPALRVGITGHRLQRLLESDVAIAGVAAQLRAVLTEIRDAAQTVAHQYAAVYAGPPLLRFISPLAEGSDQIAADAALELGYALDVPLPCLASIYTAAFQQPARPMSEDPRAAFNRLLARAESVQVLDGAPGATLDGAAYAAVGRAVLRHADVLIAVWDGTPPEGAGGTGAVVAQARSWDVPVVVIDPRHPGAWRTDTAVGPSADPTLAGAVREVLAPPPAEATEGQRRRWFGARDAQPAGTRAVAAALRRYLHTRVAWGVGGLFSFIVGIFAFEWPFRHPTVTLGHAAINRARRNWDALWTTPSRVDPALVHPINRLLRDYYAWADGLADRFGTLHRDFATTPYVLAPIAVIAILLAQVGLVNAVPVVRATVEFVILLVNFLLYLRGVFAHYHDQWIDCRSLAEQLRHLAFLWPLGRPLRPVRVSGVAETEASRSAWTGWYARAVARQGGLFPCVMTPERLEAFRQMLVERFIRPQHAYHDRTRRRYSRVHAVLHRVALVLFAGAMALAAADFISVLVGATPPTHAGLDKRFGWAALAAALAILLPGLGTGIHGFMSQGDFSNLSRRSEQMCQQLDALTAKVATTPLTVDALGDIAEDAAEVMRDEVSNWRVFARLKAPALV